MSESVEISSDKKPSLLDKVDPKRLRIGLIIFVVALLIRIAGMTWGLPNEKRYHSLHPDEEVVLAYSQAVEPAKFKFTPGFYNYGTLYLTMVRVTTDIVGGYGGGATQEDGSDLFQARSNFILAGRWLSVLAGAGMAWIIFALLVRRTHPLGAILGGASIGIAPALVTHSRFMTVDVVATFFLTAAFYWATRMIPEEGREPLEAKEILRAAVLSGVFAGLSAGTKYTGILALIVPVLIGIYAYKGTDLFKFIPKALGLAVVAALGTFVITTPGILLENSLFMKDFVFEMKHTSTGHGLVFAGTPTGFIYHLGSLLSGFGGLLLLIGLFGLGRGCLRRHPWMIGLAVFFVITYLLIGRAEVKFMRYTFPLLPPLAIGFGWLLGQGHKRGGPKARGVVALGIVGLGGVGGGMLNTLVTTNWMSGIDPRDEMGAVIKTDDQITSVGLVSDPWFYSPTFYPQIQAGPMYGPQYRFSALAESVDPQIVRYFPEDFNARTDWDSRLIQDLKPDAIVFSSFELEGVDRLAARESVPELYRAQTDAYKNFMLELQERYELVRIVGAGLSGENQAGLHPYQTIHDMMYVHPVMYLWKRKDLIEKPSSGTSTP